MFRHMVRAPGRALQKKFISLGTIKGRTRGEIVAVVGPPNSVSAMPGGNVLCQWMATGYHIAVLFDGDVCQGITHEVVV